MWNVDIILKNLQIHWFQLTFSICYKSLVWNIGLKEYLLEKHYLFVFCIGVSDDVRHQAPSSLSSTRSLFASCFYNKLEEKVWFVPLKSSFLMFLIGFIMISIS